MNVDLRYPIGILFMILGGLLTLFGAFTGADLYHVVSISTSICGGGF